MSVRRASCLVSALALLLPLLAAAAAPACGPGPHCAMAAVAEASPRCHGATMQGDDCCMVDATTPPAEAVPVSNAVAPAVADAAPALRLEGLAAAVPAAPAEAPPAPLYTLFRALLI